MAFSERTRVFFSHLHHTIFCIHARPLARQVWPTSLLTQHWKLANPIVELEPALFEEGREALSRVGVKRQCSVGIEFTCDSS